jgi:hypothetical protein
MHKQTSRDEITPKHQKQSLTKFQRGDLVGYGGESGDFEVCIASVGSPTGRALHWEHADRSRASGRFY